jgi:hypothetical protein
MADNDVASLSDVFIQLHGQEALPTSLVKAPLHRNTVFSL